MKDVEQKTLLRDWNLTLRKPQAPSSARQSAHTSCTFAKAKVTEHPGCSEGRALAAGHDPGVSLAIRAIGEAIRDIRIR